MYEVMTISIDEDDMIWDDLDVVVHSLLSRWMDTSSVGDDSDEWVLSVEGQQV